MNLAKYSVLSTPESVGVLLTVELARDVAIEARGGVLDGVNLRPLQDDDSRFSLINVGEAEMLQRDFEPKQRANIQSETLQTLALTCCSTS